MKLEELSYTVTADMTEFNREFEKSTKIIERFNDALRETERLISKIGGIPPKSSANSRGTRKTVKLHSEK